MKKGEAKKLKMELFDVISEKRNVFDIVHVKEEVETLYNLYKAAAISENSEANDIFINISMQSAINSYRLDPDLPLAYRIPFINGINFATQFIADTKDINGVKKLSLEQKKKLVLSLWKEENKEGLQEIDKVSKYYIKRGIESIIEINEIENVRGKRK